MELHQSLKYKRPRVYPGVDAPVSLSSFSPPFHIPCVDSDLTTLPFEFQVQPQQGVDASYGFASGLHFHNIQLEHSRKRRKLDKFLAMSQNSSPPSGDGYPVKFEPSAPYDQYDQNQSPTWPLWTEPAGPVGQAVTSPLENWVMDLSSIFCPGCTFGRRESDGYQSLPDAAEVMYDPDRPYFTDKQPLQQMPLSDGYESGPAVSAHHASFCCSQTNPTPNPLGVRPAQNPLPLSGHPDGNNYQQDPPAPTYYSDQLTKSEPQSATQSTFMLAPMANNDQALAQFGPSLLDMSSSPPIPPQDLVSPDGLCQYTLVPESGLIETVSPEGWDAPLYEQQSNYDILLPNQRGGKRGPFKDPSLREQTAQTRKMGSCIRCRMQRIRVSVLLSGQRYICYCVTSER
jgi:hypothetical protein